MFIFQGRKSWKMLIWVISLARARSRVVRPIAKCSMAGFVYAVCLTDRGERLITKAGSGCIP